MTRAGIGTALGLAGVAVAAALLASWIDDRQDDPVAPRPGITWTDLGGDTYGSTVQYDGRTFTCILYESSSKAGLSCTEGAPK